MPDAEEQKPVEVKKQEVQNPNRGMSKKEWRRVEALKQRLEPRIQKLETQVNEHLEKINSLGDNLRREENASRGSFYSATPSNETSRTPLEKGEEGEMGSMGAGATGKAPVALEKGEVDMEEQGSAGAGEQKQAQDTFLDKELPVTTLTGDKTQDSKADSAQSEKKQESPIGKLVGALQAAGLGEDPLRRENTDALQNGKEKPHSAQQKEEIEVKGTAIEKLLVALKQVGLGSDPTALRLVADLAALNPNNRAKPRASHLIQPSGGGVPPAPDLRAEYEKRVNELRPGDVDGLMEVKREFRRRGMEIY
jgi:hypothetical protein